MIASFARRRSAALLAPLLLGSLLLVAGCAGDAESNHPRPRTDAPATETDDSAAGNVDLGGPAYRPSALGAMGSVSGVITLSGAPPAAPAAAADTACAPEADPIASTGKGGGLSDAVVWLADVKTGKSFPIEKRAELSSADCAVDPRVQAVVVGTTVNVFNDDRAMHRLVFAHAGTHDTLTVMPFFTTGQVVASERLAKTPGVVELRDAYHPSTRGYLFVFDQPYFAVTDDDGSFTIDSLPPGTYRAMIWHEGVSAPVERQVQVAANGKATLDAALTLAHAGSGATAPSDASTSPAR